MNIPTMNSVERVHTALKLGQPDRVPVLEFGVDEKVARAAVPGCRDVADCMDRLTAPRRVAGGGGAEKAISYQLVAG